MIVPTKTYISSTDAARDPTPCNGSTTVALSQIMDLDNSSKAFPYKSAVSFMISFARNSISYNDKDRSNHRAVFCQKGVVKNSILQKGVFFKRSSHANEGLANVIFNMVI